MVYFAVAVKVRSAIMAGAWFFRSLDARHNPEQLVNSPDIWEATEQADYIRKFRQHFTQILPAPGHTSFTPGSISAQCAATRQADIFRHRRLAQACPGVIKHVANFITVNSASL